MDMYIVPKKEEKECVRDDISLKIWFYGVFFYLRMFIGRASTETET